MPSISAGAKITLCIPEREDALNFLMTKMPHPSAGTRVYTKYFCRDAERRIPHPRCAAMENKRAGVQKETDINEIVIADNNCLNTH